MYETTNTVLKQHRAEIAELEKSLQSSENENQKLKAEAENLTKDLEETKEKLGQAKAE